MIVIYAILGYMAIAWTVPRLVVPHFGFKKKPLPDIIPVDFSALIQRLNVESKDNSDFLKKCYEFVTSRYIGSRTKTVTRFWIAFEEPINHRPGFMPCTGQNYLLRLVLVKSGRFSDAEVAVKVTPLNFFLHQYLKVKVVDSWVNMNPWSSFLGVPRGMKISFFA